MDNDGLHAMQEKSAGLESADVTIFICDPGATHELFVIYRTADEDASLLELNWLEFHGQGVATGHEDQPRQSVHDHTEGWTARPPRQLRFVTR